MITVRVVLSRGRLHSLNSEGHAVQGEEGSVPCAAVSALLGAVGRLLLHSSGCTVDGSAPGPGRFALELKRLRPGLGRWYRGVTDTLLQGLRDVAREYPGAIQLIVEEKGD